MEYVTKLRRATACLEPWWTIIFAPLWQEFIFRFLPYRFWYLQTERFWLIGIASSAAFAVIHWYFGRWFVFWAFGWGIVLWAVMIYFGLLAAIVVHALVNVVDLQFGIRQRLTRDSYIRTDS